jgi:hypothetical protein
LDADLDFLGIGKPVLLKFSFGSYALETDFQGFWFFHAAFSCMKKTNCVSPKLNDFTVALVNFGKM